MASFADNEKVLCFHGPLLYEAKCVKSKKSGPNSDSYEYFVHYQGWNKNWDEWVNGDRILKHNTQNIERKNKLMSEHMNAIKDGKRKSGKHVRTSGPLIPDIQQRSSSPAHSTGSTDSKGVSTKTRHNWMYDFVSDSIPHLNISHVNLFNEYEQLLSPTLDYVDIVIPEELKYVLASDFDLVCNQSKFFNLPAKVSATFILSEYGKHVALRRGSNHAKKGNTIYDLSKNTIDCVIDGIRLLFDERISSLSYVCERNQFRRVLSSPRNGKRACQIFGSVHLLRLMLLTRNLFPPPLDQQSSLTPTIASIVIRNLLQYLDIFRVKYFTSKNYSQSNVV